MKRLFLLSGMVGLGGLLLSLGNHLQASAYPQMVARADIQQIANQTNWQQASFPVENFRGYTSLFGYRRSIESAKQEFHAGLDMSAPAGSYVRSWLAGRVIQVSDHTACGTTIKIASGAWIHTYCHLQGHVVSTARGRYISDRNGGLQIWEGQSVQAGSRIGRVGMTGRTTGPHLHWGLQYGDQWVNPALVLDPMYRQQHRSQMATQSVF